MKSSFEVFINAEDTSKRNRPTEFLANFFHSKMKGDKSISESDLEAVLDKAFSIFRYLQSQDAFEVFYRKSLAQRLILSSNSYNDELEKNCIR
jgi:cullin 3